MTRDSVILWLQICMHMVNPHESKLGMSSMFGLKKSGNGVKNNGHNPYCWER